MDTSNEFVDRPPQRALFNHPTFNVLACAISQTATATRDLAGIKLSDLRGAFDDACTRPC